jgi:hypothetical protein
MGWRGMLRKPAIDPDGPVSRAVPPLSAGPSVLGGGRSSKPGDERSAERRNDGSFFADA